MKAYGVKKAGFHCVFAMQNANNGSMTSSMRKNIQQKIITGAIDSGTSNALYERDYTNLSKPHLKGRGITNNGNDVFEFQGFFSKEEDVLEYDPNLKWCYDNEKFIEQCKIRGVPIDMSGFVEEEKKIEPKVKEEEPEFDDFEDDLIKIELPIIKEEVEKPVIEVEKPKEEPKKKVLRLNAKNKV